MADKKKENTVVTAAKSVASKLKSVVIPSPKPAAKPPKAQKSVAPARTKLLISIVNRRDELKLKEVIDDCSVALSYTFDGMGTARSQLLDYLGIGETEKTVVLSLIPETDEERIMREIRREMALYLAGRGISFTVPLTGISQIVANGLTGAATNKTTDWSKIMKSSDRKFDLVVVAVAANFVDQAMDAARAAGAAGGTILRAQSMQNDKAQQFIGITLVQEQEILLVLTKKENTLPIMEALSESVGAKTPAGGVIFSVPVDRTAGISMADEERDEKKEKSEEEKKEE